MCVLGGRGAIVFLPMEASGAVSLILLIVKLYCVA